MEQSQASRNMYERIYDKLKSLGVHESVKCLDSELGDLEVDLKLIQDTLKGMNLIFNEQSEHYSEYNNEDYSDFDDNYTISGVNEIIADLEAKDKNIDENIKRIRKKITIATEEKEMMDFLKTVLKDLNG